MAKPINDARTIMLTPFGEAYMRLFNGSHSAAQSYRGECRCVRIMCAFSLETSSSTCAAQKFELKTTRLNYQRAVDRKCDTR